MNQLSMPCGRAVNWMWFGWTLLYGIVVVNQLHRLQGAAFMANQKPGTFGDFLDHDMVHLDTAKSGKIT